MTMVESNPFTDGQTLLRKYDAFIKKISRDTAASWLKVEAEDVEQEITIFLWQKEADFLEQERSSAYIKECIRNVAKNYAQKIRNTALVELDTFYYNMDEVKEMLPTFFSGREAWATIQVPPGAESFDTRERLELMMDFSLAYDRLIQSHKDILYKKYWVDENLDSSKDRMMLSRAHNKFMKNLNDNRDKAVRAYEGTGKRKVITNAHGLSQTRGNYENNE